MRTGGLGDCRDRVRADVDRSELAAFLHRRHLARDPTTRISYSFLTHSRHENNDRL
jgi:hypothetical protein